MPSPLAALGDSLILAKVVGWQIPYSGGWPTGLKLIIHLRDGGKNRVLTVTDITDEPDEAANSEEGRG